MSVFSVWASSSGIVFLNTEWAPWPCSAVAEAGNYTFNNQSSGCYAHGEEKMRHWTNLATTSGFPGCSLVKHSPANRRQQVPSLGRNIPWRRKWQPTPVFLPGKSHGQRSLVGYNNGVTKE